MPRPKGQAHYYRRKGKRGLYAWLSNEEKHISLRTDDESEAAQRLAELVRRGGLRPTNSKKEEPTTLAKFALIAHERAKTNHTDKHANNIRLKSRIVLGYFEQQGVVFPNQVTESALEDYKSWRKAQLKETRRSTNPATSINREFDTLIKILKVAVSSDYQQAPESVLDLVRRSKVREPRPAPLARGYSREDFDKFFGAVDASYSPMFRTVLGSGLRDDEIRHLEEHDISDLTITVTPKPDWTTKSYRYRTIPASKTTVAAARSFIRTRNKLKLESKTVWTLMKDACLKAGIVPLSMQDLRKAYASHLLAAGVKLPQISKLLGHADLLTTMRYLNLVEDLPAVENLPW